MSLFFIQTSLYSYAQTLSGTVQDSNNNKLGWANISILDTGNYFIVGCTTTDEGSFSLTLPNTVKTCRLVVSYVGMRSDTLSISTLPQNNMLIRMSPNTEMLGEVHVTATRRLFKDRGDMIIADVENTVLSKSGTINNLMNQIPFVSGSDGNFNVFGRGKALLYLNGRKLYDTNELRLLSSDRIKKVEVNTNPGAKFSSEVKAVIKIYTVDNPNGLGGNVMVYLQQGRQFTNLESASLAYNRNKLQLSGSLSYSDNRASQRTQDYSEILQPKSVNSNDVDIDFKGLNTTASMELNYSISDNKNIGLNTQFNWSKMEHDITLKSLSHSADGVEDFNTNANGLSTNKPQQWITNAYYTMNLNKTHLEITNDFMLGRQYNLFDYSENTSAKVSTNGVMRNLMNSFITDANSQLGQHINLNYGFEMTYSHAKQSFGYDEDNISTGMRETSNERRQFLNAEYVNLNYTVNKWNFNIGLRYEFTQLNYYENGLKSNIQSKTYNDFFPNVNIAFTPSEVSNISVGYRRTINRPSYTMLNDNLQYNSRYQYVQGNSLLKSEYINSINFLGSYKNLRFVASYEFIDDAIMTARSVYGTSSDIILSRAINLPAFQRIQFGVNWWQKIGFYTPYLEFNVGKQYFEYKFQGNMASYHKPYFNFKFHHTFSLPKNIDVMLFLDYSGKKYDMFRMHSQQWSSLLSVSKGFSKGWFVQLSAKNIFCSSKNTSITYSDWIRDATYNDNDYQNVSFMVSYNFNYKNKKHNTYTKSSELKRF